MPISQKRELEIEQELAAIMRELDRHTAREKPRPKKPAQVVQFPWTRRRFYLTSKPSAVAHTAGLTVTTGGRANAYRRRMSNAQALIFVAAVVIARSGCCGRERWLENGVAAPFWLSPVASAD